MGVNKFFVFKEDGTLARLKSSISRFLDNDPPDNDDKVNIRASISVPASAEGLTPANNLGDVSSAETSRNNLGVFSQDDVLLGLSSKLTGPIVHLRNDNYYEVADTDKTSFTDGVNDLPMTVGGFISPKDATNFVVASKYSSSEWRFQINVSDFLEFLIRESGTDTAKAVSDDALTGYEDELVHVCATYGGSGPSSQSGTGFASAANEINLYVAGELVASTPTNAAGYAGMPNSTTPVYLGRHGSTYANGFFAGIALINRELSASEVSFWAKTGLLPNMFADQQGGANGDTYSSDFSAGTDSFTTTTGTLAGNIDAIGGQDDNLRYTLDGNAGNHSFYRLSTFTPYRRYRISLDLRIPSTNSHLDGLSVRIGTGTQVTVINETAPTQDAWVRVYGEAIAEASANNDRIYFYALDGGVDSFQDASADDEVYVRNIKITPLGFVGKWDAENYDASEDVIRDSTSNGLTATNNGCTTLNQKKHLSLDRINLLSLPTSSSGLSAGSVWNDSGTLKIV